MGIEEKDLVTGEGQEEEEEDEEYDDDDDGPPPGFHCIATQIEENLDKTEKDAEINENEDNEVEDFDGPPPGWSSIPPASFQPVHPSDVEMPDKQKEDENEEGPPPGWHSVPLASQSSEAVPADTEMGSHEDRDRCTDEGFQPGQKSIPPLKLLPPTPPRPPPAVSSTSGKVQMVCGSCRLLLAYPQGVKYVQCSCCQTVNLVLEDHQVGQVKCGGCAVLLMYPYGAPSVRCCSCHFVTEIGAHNRRPPLSVQQARRPLSVNRVQ